MRETNALLRFTKILSMNLQTNTPAVVAISPLLVCFAQSELLRADSNLVRNIVCMTLNKLGWQGIRALHKDSPKENKKLMTARRQCKCWQQVIEGIKTIFTPQHRDDYIALCHPFMAHH